MDWTSVFVEDGTEELIIPKLISAPRSSRLVSKVYHHQYHPHEAASRWELDGNVDDESSAMGGHRLLDWSPADPRRRSNSLNIQTEDEPSYSLQALYFLSINYILGVGCLGIPYAFARAGFLLCFVILLIVTLSSYMTVLWVAETGHRFEQCRPKQQQEESRCRRNHPSGVFTEHSSLLRRNSSPRSDRTTIIDPSREAYEVINLVQFYLGPWHKLLYQVSLLSLMYIGLLAYSQVFCGAIPALLWGPSGVGLGSTGSDTDTLPPTTSSWKALPQVIFGVLVVPLSCMELDEQITVQSIMALVRFVAIFIMVVGSLWALLIDGSHSTYEHAPYWAPSVTEGCQMSYTACFSGFGVAFSTSLFSQLFQHSIPGLIRPLQEQPEMLPHVPVSRQQVLSSKGRWRGQKKKETIMFDGISLTIYFTPLNFFAASLGGFTSDDIEFLSSPGHDGPCILWCRNQIVCQPQFCQFHFWVRSSNDLRLASLVPPVGVQYCGHLSGSRYD